jgi:hypothetical protein
MRAEVSAPGAVSRSHRCRQTLTFRVRARQSTKISGMRRRGDEEAERLIRRIRILRLRSGYHANGTSQNNRQ